MVLDVCPSASAFIKLLVFGDNLRQIALPPILVISECLLQYHHDCVSPGPKLNIVQTR